MITVIINTYNERRDYLEKALNSYVNQKQIDKHIIICTIEDDTNLDYMRENYSQCEFCVLTKEEHGGRSPKGCYIQLNKAIQLVKTDYWCYASSNDFAHPLKLYNEHKILTKMNKLVCYSNYVLMRYNKGPFIINFPEYDYQLHLTKNFVSDCSMMHRRVIDEFLPFNIELNNFAFWDLWLRIYEKLGNVFIHNHNATWTYRKNEYSMSVERKNDEDKFRNNLNDRTKMLQSHERK